MYRQLFIIILIYSNQIVKTQAQENVLWKFETKDRIYSSPIIDNGIVFIGSGDHNFYAIDKTTGKEIWRYSTGGAIHSTPSIQDSVVYFASADGKLYALQKTTGDLIWEFKSEGEKMYGLWDYYLSSPIIDEETIFWGCGDGNLYAIYSQTGKIKWKFKTEDIIHASPVLYNDNVFVGGFDGYFYSLIKENGSLNWKFKTIGSRYFPKGEIQKAALLDGDVAYFGSRDYNIYALDVKSGTGIWNMKQPRGWITASPIEYKGNIYFGTSDAHLFYCMDKNKGSVNWTIPLSMRVYGTAIAYNDIIYFGTFDGKMLGVNYMTGEIKWEFQTAKSKENYNTIFNEKGEFKDGFELYGKNFKESEAEIHSLGSILSSPTIEDQIIYFGSSDGNLYAVKLK
jgi:outer membrane protein assembly factor BamB